MKENKQLDILKFISSILIVASHCLPLVENECFNFFYGQWFFRFCAPLFAISSGYYFSTFDIKGKKGYIKRVWILYGSASLIYFPVYFNEGAKTIVSNLLFGYHHLWYLSALAVSLTFLLFVEKIFTKSLISKYGIYMSVMLFAMGIYFDEYHNIFNIPLESELKMVVGILGGSRHSLFFVLPLILIGTFLYERREKILISKKSNVCLVVVSFVLSLLECMVLRQFIGKNITCDVTLFNCFPAIFLFLLTFSIKKDFKKIQSTKIIRKCADIIYILHVLIIIIVEKIFDVTYVQRFLLVSFVSILCSVVCVKIFAMIKYKLKNGVTSK